jgi:hypothetical protein
MGEEPDQDRVLDALRDEQALLDEIQQVRRRHRGLRRELAATAAVHEAHVALLSKAVDEESSAPEPADPGGDENDPQRVAPSAARARVQLARSEQALSDRHVTTALKSRSGVLARVVASMSAAAAQQAVLLGGGSAGAGADG